MAGRQTPPGGQGFVIWFVGLPGSGKSSVARAVCRALEAQGMEMVSLQMDERRKRYFPRPGYSAEERAQAYRMFAEEGAALAREGKGVVLDGTAHERAMRDYARSLVGRFAEVYVRCPLATAMEREASRPEGLVMAGLYRKALERQATGRQIEGLGQVIGVDVPFEEDPAAECVVDNVGVQIDAVRDQVLDCLARTLFNNS
jgi:adenylylsulfate kinase-like enzyme